VLTGTVSGTVLDKVGNKALEGVEIVLVSTKTGVPSRKLTNVNGEYVFDMVPPGVFEITASFQGYATAKVINFSVELNATNSPVPPILLERVQGPATTMTVESRLGVVNTADSVQRMTIDTEAIRALPVSGIRTFDTFALLAPGVFPVPASAGTGPGVGPGTGTGGQFSVNGQRGRNNNFVVDGSDNNDQDVGVRRQGYVSLVPQSMESVEQFQIVSGSYLAEFGRSAGSIANAVSRSGGDTVHGSVYGYLTDDALNARNPFDQKDGPAPGESPYQRSQLGFALGGPFAKGRSWWFGSYERQTIADLPEKHFAVPVKGDRNFLGYSPEVDSNGNGMNDLQELWASNGVYFTGTGGAALWKLVPLPNNVGGPYGAHNYTTLLDGDGDGTIFSLKSDTKLTDSHSFTGRYNRTDDGLTIPVTGGALNSSIHPEVRTQNLSLFLSSVFGAQSANQARFSYGRTSLDFAEVAGSPLLFGTPNAASLAPLYPYPVIQQHLTQPTVTDFGRGSYGPFGTTGVVGQLMIRPYSPIGVDVYNFPQRRVNNTFQAADTFTWRAGTHALKFGADIRRVQQNSRLDRNLRSLAEFAPGPLTLPNSAPIMLDGTDLYSMSYSTAVLSTMIADFNNDGKPDYDTYIGLRFTEYGFFVQDDWRIAPNFTLNLGLRYEYNSTPTEVNDKIESALMDPTAGIPAQVYEKGEEGYKAAYENMLSQYKSVVGGRDKMYEADAKSWAPRIGFAWDPTEDGRTSVRGGFGIFYDQVISAVTSQSRNVFPRLIPLNSSGFNSPILGDYLLTRQWRLFQTEDQTVYTHLRPTTASTIGIPANLFGVWLGTQASQGGQGLAFTLPTSELKNPYAQHYHLTLEREIMPNTLLSAAYVGTRGAHLTRFRMPNGGLIGKPSADSVLLNGVPVLRIRTVSPNRLAVGLGAYSQFENSASSAYHSFQLRGQRRFSQGFQFSAAWTWAHAIDDVSDVFDAVGFFALPQSDANLRAERASANFDVRHRVVGSFLWDLPWARQNAIVGGWRFSGIVTMQTGQPYTVNSSFDINGDGILTDRLNTTAGIVEQDDGVVHYTLPAGSLPEGAVSPLLAPWGKSGAIGRNTFRARGIGTLDLAIHKIFRFSETANLEFRSEFFNFLNRTHYGVPVRILEAPAFGRAVDTSVNARQIQFALKLSY
jgi:outer membrane receptor protein involved in Fe transport